MKTLLRGRFFIPFILLTAGLALSPDATINMIYKPIKFIVMQQDTLKKSLVLEKVMVKPFKVLYITDTTSMAEISKAIGKDYGELYSFIGQQHLKPGRAMAFYESYSDPITMDVAVEVDHEPAPLSGRIKSRTIEGGEAVVAHYTGPYEEMEGPYNEITKWLRDNNRQPREMPFEVYLNSPSEVKDKTELKTDVYQMLK